MPLDMVMIKACLAAMANNSGRGPITEELIGLHVEMKLHRPITTDQLRAALVECRAQKFAVEDQDRFGQATWEITEQGMEAHRRP